MLQCVLNRVKGESQITNVVKLSLIVGCAFMKVVAESSVALMKVSRGYNRLRRSIAAKRITGAENIEQAWLREHKAAAQQVAHLMDDLPDRYGNLFGH